MLTVRGDAGQDKERPLHPAEREGKDCQPPPGAGMALMLLVSLRAAFWRSACRGNFVRLLETKRALAVSRPRHSGEEERKNSFLPELQRQLHPAREGSTALRTAACAAAVGNKLLSSVESETWTPRPWFLECSCVLGVFLGWRPRPCPCVFAEFAMQHRNE